MGQEPVSITKVSLGRLVRCSLNAKYNMYLNYGVTSSQECPINVASYLGDTLEGHRIFFSNRLMACNTSCTVELNCFSDSIGLFTL